MNTEQFRQSLSQILIHSTHIREDIRHKPNKTDNDIEQYQMAESLIYSVTQALNITDEDKEAAE